MQDDSLVVSDAETGALKCQQFCRLGSGGGGAARTAFLGAGSMLATGRQPLAATDPGEAGGGWVGCMFLRGAQGFSEIADERTLSAAAAIQAFTDLDGLWPRLAFCDRDLSTLSGTSRLAKAAHRPHITPTKKHQRHDPSVLLDCCQFCWLFRHQAARRIRRHSADTPTTISDSSSFSHNSPNNGTGEATGAALTV